MRAEDDEDEELILDQKNWSLSRHASQAKSNSQTLGSPSVTLVASQKTPAAKKTAEEDSETEPESDEEPEVKAVDKPAKQLPKPASESDFDDLDDVSPVDNRIISHGQPLADFHKNMNTGDLVTKAVEDLAWVIKDVVMKPFAGRRQDEMLKCMDVLREACLKVRIGGTCT